MSKNGHATNGHDGHHAADTVQESWAGFARSHSLVEAMEQIWVQVGDKRGYTFVAPDGTERYFGFRALIDEARARGRRLRALGLKKGDRLAMVIPDADEFVLTFLAAVTQGILPVPLYPPLALGRLDAYLDTTVRILEAAGADVLITTGQVQNILWSVMTRVPTLRDLITVEKMQSGRESTSPVEPIGPDDPLFLQFTSGSTAAPKGVVVTHKSLCANAWAIMSEGLKADPEAGPGVSWLPLYHDMGLIGFVLAPLLIGHAVVFIPTLSFVKRPTLWMDVIHKHRGTISFAPNFAFARLAKRATDRDLAKWDLSCIRVMGCGAEPIHPGTMRAFLERLVPTTKMSPNVLLPCYGMAEATLAMSFIDLGAPLHVDSIDPDACYEKQQAIPAATGTAGPLELVSCGKAFAGHELGIFDDDGKRLGEREIGEIWFRGPSVAHGYFRNAEATRASFLSPDDGGWLKTGDLGYSADGNVYISGRKKDILIVHGRNYYPQGIEWLVEEVSGIRKGNVVAFSVPGATSEEVVVVAETAEEDHEKRKEIAAKVKHHLSAQMGLAVGEVVLLGVGELPKTTSGKLQRRKTREQFMNQTLGTEGVRILGSTGERLQLAKHVASSFVSRVRHTVTNIINPRRKPGPDSDDNQSA